ncbi:hypothetical protein BC830DRAFT_443466 [Chytriomyces sp. MP71]|nr:hypothetical protein BC830DRAFT_443466 [Chytriomyces sp. MP71]
MGTSMKSCLRLVSSGVERKKMVDVDRHLLGANNAAASRLQTFLVVCIIIWNLVAASRNVNKMETTQLAAFIFLATTHAWRMHAPVPARQLVLLLLLASSSVSAYDLLAVPNGWPTGRQDGYAVAIALWIAANVFALRHEDPFSTKAHLATSTVRAAGLVSFVLLVATSLLPFQDAIPFNSVRLPRAFATYVGLPFAESAEDVDSAVAVSVDALAWRVWTPLTPVLVGFFGWLFGDWFGHHSFGDDQTAGMARGRREGKKGNRGAEAVFRQWSVYGSVVLCAVHWIRCWERGSLTVDVVDHVHGIVGWMGLAYAGQLGIVAGGVHALTVLLLSFMIGPGAAILLYSSSSS